MGTAAPRPTWHQPIPGEAGPMYHEVVRLNQLRDWCWAAADELRAVGPDWDGPAHDQFIEFRDRLVQRWRLAGDLHNDAAHALGDYHVVLLDMQRRANHLVEQADYGAHPVRAPAAWADIQRLWMQVQKQGRIAAAAIKASADALAAFQSLPADDIPQQVPVGRPTEAQAAMVNLRPPVPSIPVRRRPATSRHDLDPAAVIDPDPRLAATDSVAFKRDVRVLVAEILLGEHRAVRYPDGGPQPV